MFCDFCYALSIGDGGTTPEYVKLCGEAAPSRVVGSWPESFAVVALGPLAIGNLLVLPREHFDSLAEVPAGTLTQLVLRVHELAGALAGAVGPVFAFEHGGPADSESGSCISHAHLQLVPSAADYLPAVKAQLSGVEIRGISDLPLPDRSEYLYCSSLGLAEHWVFDSPGIPPQFMRRLFAASEPGTEWNWRKEPYCERVSKTRLLLQRLSYPIGI